MRLLLKCFREKKKTASAFCMDFKEKTQMAKVNLQIMTKSRFNITNV